MIAHEHPALLIRHLGAQLPGLLSLGGALVGLRRPAEATIATIAPLDRTLVRDYVLHVGGDPARYRSTVPPHLFPQWGLPLAARTLAARTLGGDYPIHRVINAGCRLEVHAPLPADEPLHARATLESVVDDGRRVTIVQKVTTGTRAVPDAVVATIHAIIPLGGEMRGTRGTHSTRAGGRAGVGTGTHTSSGARASASAGAGAGAAGGGGARRGALVPYDASEVARWKLAKDAGLAFAMLTGDFNPIHWSSRAGRAAGFGGPILHGFAILARAIEGLARFAPNARVWDARFTRPLRLPADVGLFVRGNEAWIGEAPGVGAVMTLQVEA